MSGGRGNGRLNSFHGTKRNLVGSTAGRVAPAWKASNIPNGQASGSGPKQAIVNNGVNRIGNGLVQASTGSKILLSNLPQDVRETEIEELMRKTIGPLKDMFMIYNSQGLTKGMAIVTFHKASDAARAREKYHGKVIDGRKALKIEIIVDTDNVKGVAILQEPRQKTLFDRLGVKAQPSPKGANPAVQASTSFVGRARRNRIPLVRTPLVQANHPAAATMPVTSSRRSRQKRGPRRVKKTITQLDQEMEDYRAGAIDTEGGEGQPAAVVAMQ